MKYLLSWWSRLLAHLVFSLSWNWCFNKGPQIPFWMYPILNLQTFQKSKHWSTQQSSPLDTRHCLLTQWITSVHEHKEKHCSSRNRQGSNYLVALETIISLIRGQPRVISMDACLGESLWYHPGVWPAHGLYSEWSLALTVPQEKRHRREYDAPKKRPAKVLGNRLLVIASWNKIYRFCLSRMETAVGYAVLMLEEEIGSVWEEVSIGEWDRQKTYGSHWEFWLEVSGALWLCD